MNSPLSRDSNRWYSDAEITGAGTPSSTAASTVQRPSPESDTWPLKSSSLGDLAKAAAVSRLDPIFKTIAPGTGTVEPTPGRVPGSAASEGYLYCGPSGAGHFVKMVHNGVEYGMMAAIAEGLAIIRYADVGLHMDEIDAETTPLRAPEAYQYEINVGDVAEVWRRGSVVSSWLIDLTAAAFAKSPQLEDFSGHVSDSGEGRWTVLAAVDEGVPAPVISASLYQRFESRDNGEFTGKILSALRSEFGGHAEKKK